MDEAGLAADTAVDTTAPATAPEEPQAIASTKKAKKQAKPEARTEPLEPDPMFLGMLLRTQRLLERETPAPRSFLLFVVYKQCKLA